MGLAHDRLIRRLEAAAGLTAREAAALRELPLALRRVQADSEVVREGDRPTECCLVVDGLLVRQKTTSDGRRQIMSLHTPGDFVDLQSMHLKVMDHSVGAIGACTVGLVAHAEIRAVGAAHPGLAAIFLREAVIDAAIHREWILNIGARPALERTAHLLCELFLKMQAVGLTSNGRCPLPLTQRDLADCMGLSPVHVNRTLQELRRARLIVLGGRALGIPDLAALQAAAQFDPSYLHLAPTAA